jgi:sarcosine oxidase gamma subunit
MSTSAAQKKIAPARQASTAARKKMTPAEHRVQVAAARLRVTLDERLGRKTPERTRALAQEEL